MIIQHEATVKLDLVKRRRRSVPCRATLVHPVGVEQKKVPGKLVLLYSPIVVSQQDKLAACDHCVTAVVSHRIVRVCEYAAYSCCCRTDALLGGGPDLVLAPSASWVFLGHTVQLKRRISFRIKGLMTSL